jgi:serine protease Do
MRYICTFPRRVLQLAPALALFTLGLSVVAPTAHAQKGGKGGKGQPAPNVEVKGKFAALFREPAAKATQSVVRVLCNGKDTALGVAVTVDGFILTKASDLEGKITVRLSGGDVKEAKLVGSHEAHDLAMLKIEAQGLTVVAWTESKVAAVGHFVASPRPGGDPVVGVVSVATRDIPNARIQPATPPANSGYLGVALADEELGAVIGDVTKGSAAEKAGVKVRDVILAVSGRETPDAEALIKTIQTFKAGETVVLKIRRGDDEIDLKATLAPRPKTLGGPSRGDIQNSMGSKLSKRKSGFPVVLQHDSVVLPEDCGGPLVDLAGNVVGINICRKGRVESWAVPSEVIRPLLNDLMTGKLAPRNGSAPSK